ncbi:CG30 [Choristoneura rosaceana nucleopolyhedrovirus]|uniref:CG30 n=1 Tax=Choristoneura rosaceana nucleopolyhedrovirus TaxID=58094 RepID=S5MR37_9ABAC|nr:CG30 [Choristoneura rosaceana nucleopolyhedrovirus]AGR57103.1 CG30 [Choristoneura rosaceana nucleopolyhedrovirus]
MNNTSSIVKLQCSICYSVGEIKNYFLLPTDTITVLPIVELYTCKHQLCATCVRKIAQRGRDKRVECPMCRRKNAHLNVYSVSRNSVDALRCAVSDVREYGCFNGLVDAASLARQLFEQSLLDAEPAPENPFKPSELQNVLERLQTQIDKQIKVNYEIQLRADTLTQTFEELKERLNKSQSDYNDVCKHMEALRNDRLREERALQKLINEHAQWADKNAKMQRENDKLTNENIGLIKDNYLFKQTLRSVRFHFILVCLIVFVVETERFRMVNC